MSSWSELLDRAEPEEHIVQLYGGDDPLLTRNASRFLAEGLRSGDGLIVISTGEHAKAILRQLNQASVNPSQAVEDGRLVFLDARTTLDRFLVDGEPDRDLFRRVLDGVLEDLRTRSLSGKIRAFGEMVGLLWVGGQQTAALRLEHYWNELLVGSASSLFCAYPIDIFDGATEMDGLDALLCAHTHMYAGPGTMLSSARAAR